MLLGLSQGLLLSTGNLELSYSPFEAAEAAVAVADVKELVDDEPRVAV